MLPAGPAVQLVQPQLLTAHIVPSPRLVLHVDPEIHVLLGRQHLGRERGDGETPGGPGSPACQASAPTPGCPVATPRGGELPQWPCQEAAKMRVRPRPVGSKARSRPPTASIRARHGERGLLFRPGAHNALGLRFQSPRSGHIPGGCGDVEVGEGGGAQEDCSDPWREEGGLTSRIPERMGGSSHHFSPEPET